MKVIDELREENMNKSRALALRPGSTSFLNEVSRSVLNQTGNSVVSDSMMNQSITAEMAILKLEENLQTLETVNAKLNEDNTRLRRERDHYRGESLRLKNYIEGKQHDRSPRSGEEMSYSRYR